MVVLGVIPARFASTRFPGKPLVDIAGTSMVMRVYNQAKKTKSLDDVVVATDDIRIFQHVTEHGGVAVMTSDSHISGTSRIVEVLGNSEINPDNKYQLVVNIQGDEPFVNPLQIDQLVSCFVDSGIQIATLIKQIVNNEDIFNPNVVKVVSDSAGMAMYFSRAPIPYTRSVQTSEWGRSIKYFRHVGLYAYRTETLKELTKLPSAPSEEAESLEQLRWLYHGYRIKTSLTDIETIGIDTPEDLLKLTNNP